MAILFLSYSKCTLCHRNVYQYTTKTNKSTVHNCLLPNNTSYVCMYVSTRKSCVKKVRKKAWLLKNNFCLLKKQHLYSHTPPQLLYKYMYYNYFHIYIYIYLNTYVKSNWVQFFFLLLLWTPCVDKTIIIQI